MCTVQELIDQLNQVKDKSISVHITVEYGMGCGMTVTDVDTGGIDMFIDPETDEEIEVYIIGGEEDTRFMD